MVFVLVRHRVKDFAAWKPVFDGAKGMRRSGGEQYYQVFQSVADPNHVIGLFHWDTLENARIFFESDELRSKMQQAGVAEQPEVYYLEETAQGSL